MVALSNSPTRGEAVVLAVTMSMMLLSVVAATVGGVAPMFFVAMVSAVVSAAPRSVINMVHTVAQWVGRN